MLFPHSKAPGREMFQHGPALKLPVAHKILSQVRALRDPHGGYSIIPLSSFYLLITSQQVRNQCRLQFKKGLMIIKEMTKS